MPEAKVIAQRTLLTIYHGKVRDCISISNWKGYLISCNIFRVEIVFLRFLVMYYLPFKSQNLDLFLIINILPSQVLKLLDFYYCSGKNQICVGSLFLGGIIMETYNCNPNITLLVQK